MAGPTVQLGLDAGLGDHWLPRLMFKDAKALYEDFKEILTSFDEELLKPALSNESIPDNLLVSLYKKQEPFANLTDKQWLRAIAFTASNPRLGTPYPYGIDLHGEMSYREVFTSAWQLFETLPVDKTSAVVLLNLAENLLPNKPHDMDVIATIKRWEIESEKSDCPFEKCRYLLARLIPRYELKDSHDIALRKSYYSRFSTEKPEEITELFEKDTDKFLEEAVHNQTLYINEVVREELRKCCYDHERWEIYANSFKGQVERLEQEHPEWFPNLSGDIPFNAVKDPVLRASKYFESLEKQTKIISRKLIESESEDQPSLIDDMKITLSDVKTSLNEANRLLSSLLSKGVIAIGSGLLIIGVLIGFILTKWL